MAWKEEDHPRDELGQFTDGNGSKSGNVKEALDREGMNGPTGRFGTIVLGKGEDPEIEQTSGATSGAVDPDSERGQEHAERFYEEMRHRKDDISSIAKNTGFSKNDIEKIKNYIFFDEHNLSGVKKRFDPSCDMAHSWQRLMDNKAVEADYIMLRHELYEIKLKEQGYSHSQAHLIASRKFNYTDAIELYKEQRNGKFKKHKKNQ